MQSKNKKQVQEISFILQNIFIVHPNPHSKYKVRIIASRDDSNNSFRKVSQKYIFKITNNLAQLKERACFLVLLQKNKKEGQNAQYVEIGRGQINLSQIIEGHQIKGQSTVHGVVYGTKTQNSNRIIAKCSYKVSKRKDGSPQSKSKRVQQIIKTPNKSPMSKQKVKDKNPFIFQHSLQQQQRVLQSKIKQLAKSMNKIMSREEVDEPYEQQQQTLLSNGLKPIRQSVMGENQYYYKYKDKFAKQLIDTSANPKQLTALTIKNIRIENRTKKSQEQNLLEAVQVDNLKIDLSKSKYSQKNIEEILLVFYELFQERRVRKRWLEIYLPLYLNKDNRNLVHQILYLPKTNNKILIQISFLSDFDTKYRNLNGVIQPSVAKSRLVQFFDMDNLQKGIMICQVERCIEVDKDEVKNYKKQAPVFDKVLRKHGNVSQLVKLMKPSYLKEQLPAKQITYLNNNLKDTLYSNFHENKEVKHFKRKRYSTSVDQQSGKLEATISRYDRSLAASKRNLSLSTKNSNKFFSKSIRAFPSMMESVVQKGNKEGYYNGKNIKYRLYIESAQCYIYQMNDMCTKFLLKLTMNGKSQNKKLIIGQADWHTLHVEFRQFAIKDFLSVELLVNKRNTTVYKRVGKCNIMMNELQENKNKYKFFIYRENKEVGYLVFKFKMFKKDPDQKSQSFYYQQEVQRKSLLRSEAHHLGQKSQYSELGESIIIRSETDKSFDKLDFKEEQKQLQFSFESKHIEPANSTKIHYISQKVSEGRISEQLENEDYQNGETILRRF